MIITVYCRRQGEFCKFVIVLFYQVLKMMICCVVGCTNKPDKDSPLRFHHIPRIRTKHGEDSWILSTERRKEEVVQRN